MAQVAQDSELQNRIEEFLTYLTNEWEAIPAIASEWDSWDEYSRMAFVLDWPIREDRLAQLCNYLGQDLLTDVQVIRYWRLLQLVGRNRPMLERLVGP